MLRLGLIAAAFIAAIQACTFSKNCWGSGEGRGCTVTVKGATGGLAKATVGNGGSITNGEDIWNAQVSSHSGNTFDISVQSPDFGFNVRGTDQVEVSCPGGSSGGGSRGTTQSCIFSKSCWGSGAGRGCTVTVKGATGGHAKATVGNGGSITNGGDIWNAQVSSHSGNTFDINVQSPEFGFNVRGTDQVNVSCKGGSSGGGSSGGGSSGGGSSGSGEILKPTQTMKSGLARFKKFLNKLSTIVSTNSMGNVRVIHSSGGAAGGVVSEGQGYGLLLAGANVATTSGNERAEAITHALELFNGWKTMCQKSVGDRSCQNPDCNGAPCSPHWKFSDDLASVLGTGSAPDGDEDAYLGMILLVQATQNEGHSWWDEIAGWAYKSCKGFIDFSTVDGDPRVLKLGSCWGGWDCNNPSYFSPAHWRVFRDYMKSYKSQFGSGEDYTSKWNNLIKTSYEILQANQCPATGLTTNWWVPSKSNPTVDGSTGCSASGTPAAEFGAEASRGVWRVALDYLWYRSQASDGVGAKTYCTRVAKHITQKANSNKNLDTGCHVLSVHSGWLDNAFMYGPVAAALIVDSGASGQQQALDKMAEKLDSSSINDYYSGSWTAISTMTLNGDFEKAKQFLP